MPKGPNNAANIVPTIKRKKPAMIDPIIKAMFASMNNIAAPNNRKANTTSMNNTTKIARTHVPKNKKVYHRTMPPYINMFGIKFHTISSGRNNNHRGHTPTFKRDLSTGP